MHEAEIGACVGHHTGELRFAAERGDVVDHRRSGLESAAGHLGLGRVDGDRLAPQSLEHRLDAAQLLVQGNAVGTWTCRFSADVHDRRALLEEAVRARGCRLRPQSLPTVGE